MVRVYPRTGCASSRGSGGWLRQHGFAIRGLHRCVLPMKPASGDVVERDRELPIDDAWSDHVQDVEGLPKDGLSLASGQVGTMGGSCDSRAGIRLRMG